MEGFVIATTSWQAGDFMRSIAAAAAWQIMDG
jgi:hypothetical protein